MRVVSLLPSATEIVYALGIEPVAVSHSCDHPPEARGKPAITHTSIDADADSATIDEQVLTAERAGGVYGIDTAALERVDPDLIVTQGVCDVCAVDTVLVHEAVERLELDCEVLTADPHGLDDVFDDIERIGQAIGRGTHAAELVSDLRDRVDRVGDRVPDPADGPRVLDLDWMDPTMVGGHWVPGLVERAGGEYGLVEPGQVSTPVEWGAVREFDPEVLVLAPCGFGIDQTVENVAELTRREGWEKLTAVRKERVFVVDGAAYLNRPSHRLVDSLEILAGLLHPERVDPPTEAMARRLEPRSPA